MTNGFAGDPRPNERMNDIDWNVLDRYFSGEASPDEVASVTRWTARPGGADLLQSVREIWDAAGVISTPSSPDVNAAWRSLMQRAEHGGADGAEHDGATSAALPLAQRTSRQSRPFRRFAPRIWPMVLAASVIAAASVFAVNRIASRGAATSSATGQPTREFVTRRAQRADVYLSDGTRVLLNVDSRLRVPAGYGERARTVMLEGEAYFDVVHNTTRPFRVITAAGIAEDIGTAFVVAHYPETKGMQVSVASGAVIVRRDSSTTNGTTLQRGDLARMDDAGRVSVTHGVDMENELAWTTGKLVFERVPLRDVVPRLARWFDADIRLGDSSLNDVRYTASIRNEPVRHVLDLLAASLDARVERDVTGYVLYAGKR